MKKVAILTDSNSGVTIAESIRLGVFVIPMPFTIDGEVYREEIDLSQQAFYELLKSKANISTSQPAVGVVTETWDNLLKDYQEVVYIPMSSGLSESCHTAQMFAEEEEYMGKVHVVNNQRISVTQYQSILDAIKLADEGKNGREIKEYLENDKFNSSIYITVDTLSYLQKGGRITPAAALLGGLLRIKPTLQIQGEKLDAFAKSIGLKQAKMTMINQMRKDMTERFNATPETYQLAIAYTPGDTDFVNKYIEDVKAEFPGYELVVHPLSLSVACHIGPGAFALAISHKY